MKTRGASIDLKQNSINIIRPCRNLCDKLQKLMNDISVLGSVMSLYRAADGVKSALHDFIELYEDIDPKVKSGKQRGAISKHKAREKQKLETNYRHDDLTSVSSKLEPAKVFKQLIDAFKQFDFAFRDFHDYADRDGEDTLSKFIKTATVVHSALTFYGDQNDTEYLRTLIDVKGGNMAQLLASMPDALSRFTKEGIPCIKVAQARSASMRANASTVATFFAGVAATTLQFSIEHNENAIQVATNALWLASLVLSIGSATSALLAMTWQQAVFSSPARDLPWYIVFWTRQGYLVLLVVSVLAFIAGLLCYVHELQDRFSFLITAASTAFCAVGLSLVVIWIEYERWEFTILRELMRSDHGFAGTGRVLLSIAIISLRSMFSKARSTYGRSSASRDAQIKDKERIKEKHDANAIKATGISNRVRADVYSSFKNEGTNATISSFHIVDLPQNLAISSEVELLSMSPSGTWLIICFKKPGPCQCGLFKLSGLQDSFQINISHYLDLACDFPVEQVEWLPYGDDDLFMTRAKDGVRVWFNSDGRQCASFLVSTGGLYTDCNVMWVHWFNHQEILILVGDKYGAEIKRYNIYDEREESNYVLQSNGNLLYTNVYSDSQNDLAFIVATHHVEDEKIDYMFVLNLGQYDANSRQGKAERFHSANPFYNHPADDYKGVKSIFMAGIPLLHDVESLSLYADTGQILIGYEHDPPELWEYSVAAGGVRLRRIHELRVPSAVAPKDPKVYWDDAFFVDNPRGTIASMGNELIYFWDRFNGQLVKTLRFERSSGHVPEIAWCSTIDGTVIICCAWGMGEMAICTNVVHS